MYTPQTLIKKILEVGVDNIVLKVQMRVKGYITFIEYVIPEDAPVEIIDCKILEDRYKVRDNYMVDIKPINIEWNRMVYRVPELVKAINNKKIILKKKVKGRLVNL